MQANQELQTRLCRGWAQALYEQGAIGEPVYRALLGQLR